MSTSILVELDARRRTSLSKVGRPEHRRYLATEEPDGTIILSPAVVMTEAELDEIEERIRNHPTLLAEIRDNIAHPERAKPRPKRKAADED